MNKVLTQSLMVSLETIQAKVQNISKEYELNIIAASACPYNCGRKCTPECAYNCAGGAAGN